MTKKIKNKCRVCKLPCKGLYCSLSHKSLFNQRLRSDKFNTKSPEEFIKEELTKPINKAFAQSVILREIPFIARGELAKNLIYFCETMQQGEIRKIKASILGVNGSGSALINYRKKFPTLKLINKTIDGELYVFLEKL